MDSNLGLMVLGSAQDGGYPHIGCKEQCCQPAWIDLNKKRLVASVAIIDKKSNECWIIDASPDIKHQINMIIDFLEIDTVPKIKGIFLTHAHTGHYSGLLELGKEALNSFNIPLYVMPRMYNFIQSNEPFRFLMDSKNIFLKPIEEKEQINLSTEVSINSFLVPHRNELSETVGYKIRARKKTIIYLPDIDSWDDWDENILDIIDDNDILLIDGTFYDKNELNNREISKIPHPSIIESMEKFSVLDRKAKNKIFFTHFNHTNTAIQETHLSNMSLIEQGYKIVNDGDFFCI